MAKPFQTALSQVVGRARRMSSIELQNFAYLDAVYIINDRALSTPSDEPNDLYLPPLLVFRAKSLLQSKYSIG